MELTNLLWVEKWRPQTLDDLIFDNKRLIINSIKDPMSMPSFIFYSNKPGTGKTTLAKIIIRTLDCDSITINASDERGIDTIREKIGNFARNLSTNPNSKRCVFLDEADSLTKQAQESLKSTMEEFSGNTFFIFTANDVNKIVEPIQSRCTLISFEKPNKTAIINRLEEIIKAEGLVTTDAEIEDLVNFYYPDMRSMIKSLQQAKIDNKPIVVNKQDFIDILNKLKSGDIVSIYHKTYSGEFDLYAFNRFLFSHIFLNAMQYKNIGEIALCCAEIEKGFNIGANAPVIFIANMTKISKLMKG